VTHMKPSAGAAVEVIKHILDFSADAHIRRREVAEGSPIFYQLTGMISAFGEVLGFLALLERPEQSYMVAAR
jgi:hypothetical protein